MAIERRWLTPPAGHTQVQGLSVRRLAVKNLQFFLRLCGAEPPLEVIGWAVANVDELELSLFRERGATAEEAEDFRRQMLAQDRPERYKRAWTVKIAHKPAKKNRERKKKNEAKK